jgi:ribosomal protein S18 acetylase RimI-like enzyme
MKQVHHKSHMVEPLKGVASAFKSVNAIERAKAHLPFHHTRRRRSRRRISSRSFSSSSSSNEAKTEATPPIVNVVKRDERIENIARDFRRSFTLVKKKEDKEEEVEEETSIVVRAIREKDVSAAAKVFQESFSGSPDEKPRSFVLRYLLEACVVDDDDDDDDDKKNKKNNPYEVCFVGVTTTIKNGETKEITEGEVISLVSVALDVRSRIVDDPNPPPSDAPYVCNMAVSSRHRNKGVAKAMLEAIGEFVPSVGGCDVWLHVREVDGKAVRVYERFGFETVKVDEKNPLLNLVMNRKESRKGRALMRKVLAEGCNFIV